MQCISCKKNKGRCPYEIRELSYQDFSNLTIFEGKNILDFSRFLSQLNHKEKRDYNLKLVNKMNVNLSIDEVLYKNGHKQN